MSVFQKVVQEKSGTHLALPKLVQLATPLKYKMDPAAIRQKQIEYYGFRIKQYEEMRARTLDFDQIDRIERLLTHYRHCHQGW